mgnify:CR=1
MTICFFTKAQILAMTTSLDCHEKLRFSRNDEFTFDSFFRLPQIAFAMQGLQANLAMTTSLDYHEFVELHTKI